MIKRLELGVRPPWAIAHRGFSARYPENSLPAFRAALRTSIQGIECDVQLSRDEFPVVFHDRTLFKVGGGLRRVRTQAVDDLVALDIRRRAAWGQPTLLPTLDEVLDVVAGKTALLVEIKIRERDPKRLQRLAEATVERILTRDLADQVWILSYDRALLQWIHGTFAGIRCVWNSDRAVLLHDADWLAAYSVRHQALGAEFVEAAHRAGKPVLTFTCNTPTHLQRVLDLGVDGVMSDDPAWLVGTLKGAFAQETKRADP